MTDAHGNVDQNDEAASGPEAPEPPATIPKRRWDIPAFVYAVVAVACLIPVDNKYVWKVLFLAAAFLPGAVKRRKWRHLLFMALVAAVAAGAEWLVDCLPVGTHARWLWGLDIAAMLAVLGTGELILRKRLRPRQVVWLVVGSVAARSLLLAANWSLWLTAWVLPPPGGSGLVRSLSGLLHPFLFVLAAWLILPACVSAAEARRWGPRVLLGSILAGLIVLGSLFMADLSYRLAWRSLEKGGPLLAKHRRYETVPLLMRYALCEDDANCRTALRDMQLPRAAFAVLRSYLVWEVRFSGRRPRTVEPWVRERLVPLLGRDVGDELDAWCLLYDEIVPTAATPLPAEIRQETDLVIQAMSHYYGIHDTWVRFALKQVYASDISWEERRDKARAFVRKLPDPDWNVRTTDQLIDEILRYERETRAAMGGSGPLDNPAKPRSSMPAPSQDPSVP